MKQYLLIIIFSTFSFLVSGQQETKLKSIDTYIKEFIKINEIPGLALGVVKDNKVIFEKYYGTENLEDREKVDKNSLFRVYSTTKLITNIGVFQLIENGKLSPDDNISKYIENLPSEWQNVKIKNLLSHSSGIPDFALYNDNLGTNITNPQIIERLSKEKMEFETGNEYRYNQTNYWLLALIIEKITGQKFENFILKTQFSDSENQVVFSSNSKEKIPNRIQKYNYDGATKKYKTDLTDLGKRSIPANGLALTLPAFLEWSIHLNKNDFLKAETKRMMWKPFEYKNKSDFFGYGWEIFKINNKYSYGFSGGNVSIFRVFPDEDLSIILMYNGSNSFPVQYQAVNHIAGLIDRQLADPFLVAEEANISESRIQPNRKKETYGYRIEDDKIIFSYQLPKMLKTKQVTDVSIAGSFNDWNPENKSYKMTAVNDNTYELKLPISQFEKGKTYSFKFVMNGTGWLSTPGNALNTDGTSDNNLILKVN